MKKPLFGALALALVTSPLAAQTFATDDPILQSIWTEGMDNSETYRMSQVLSDSIGPRLTGTPGQVAGIEWLLDTYEEMGIQAEAEEYGEWIRWERGRTHVDLMEPRVRTLEAMLMAWSPGTDGRTVRAEVITLPDVSDAAAFQSWLPSVRGKFVAISANQLSCRPNSDVEEHSTGESYERFQADRQAHFRAWNQRLSNAGYNARSVIPVLEQAGAAGIISSRWSNGWGTQKISAASTSEVPQIDIGCEDYGMLVRLAENNQSPVIDVMAEGEFNGLGRMSNVLAVIPGTERPNEYVMLSAHFDSWDGGSASTDNGTGTVTMLEAMRILKEVYPNPRRTIIVGHWSGEEQGLLGSTEYGKAHPEIVDNLQALFNQDNGTGRVANISGQGFTAAGEYFGRWLTSVPREITQHIDVNFPGTPASGGSDYASFVCQGAPAFSLSSLSWNYGTYTWHTNRDTFDKISFDDLKNNATLTAMLVYLASEEETMIPRDQRSVFPVSRRTGQPGSWPTCRDRRTWEGYHNTMMGR